MNVSATTTIDRPAAVVFDCVMDTTHDAKWRNGIIEVACASDPSHDVGATGFDSIEAKGREMVAAWTALAFEPGVLARWTFDSEQRIRTWRVVGAGHDCLVALGPSPPARQ